MDTSIQKLTNRFDVGKSDKKRLEFLEAMIITETSNTNVAHENPEIDTRKPDYQLPILKWKTGAASMDEARFAYGYP